MRVARAMGKAAPKTIVWMGPGVAMTPRGTYAAMAVHALNGMLGSIDAEGGVWQSPSGPPLAAFPKADAYVDEMAKEGSKGKKLDGRGAKDMPAMMNAGARQRRGHQQRGQRHAEGPGRLQGVHLLVVQLQLLRHRRPALGQGAWPRCRSSCTWCTNASEMTQFADIVLPSTFNSAEGWSIVTNMGNGYAYASIQQGAIKRLWDVKQEETEVMWLLAEKLKAKGFANLFDYYSKEFKDPETGKAPTTALEFSEIATKMTSAPIWMAKEPLKGDAPINGWADFKKKGIFSGPKYTLKKGWGGKFATATKKFEFYSETLKKGLLAHAKKYETTLDDILTVSGYVARGELAFVPHYETVKRHGSVGGLSVHLHRLQVAPEPRGPFAEHPLVPGVQEGRSG